VIKNYSVADSDGQSYFIVKAETDEGIYGLGEVVIREWGGTIKKAIEHLSEMVVGENPFSTECLWQHMFAEVSSQLIKCTPVQSAR
jgi:L-alanine-DL-glutamate epimerase-like enolase superfamily enzyme